MNEAAMKVGGKIIEDRTVQSGEPWGRTLMRRQHLRIIDLEGKQAVDFLCYNAQNPEDRYNAANTRKLNVNVYLGKGSKLWSDRAKALMSVREDTCGKHDTVGGCCSSEINELRYGVKNMRNCRDTFEEALKEFGMGRGDIAENVNFFMHVPIAEDGHLEIVDGLSKPGDYVDLVAETDVICIISNCAQRNNPCNGFNPTPIRVVVYED